MSQGTITTNGTNIVFSIQGGPIKLSFGGTFDGATIALEEKVDDVWLPLLDESTAISYTAPNAFAYNLFSGTTIRFNVSGGGGSMSIPFGLNYNNTGASGQADFPPIEMTGNEEDS